MRVRVRAELAVILRDPALRLLGAAFLIEGVATSTTSAILPYVVTHVLHRPADYLGGLFLTLILCSLLFMPLWAWIAARIGKKAAFAGAALAATATALSLSLLNPAYPGLLLYPQFGLIAFGFAGLQMLPFAMITDVIQNDGLVRCGSREGLFSGVWTAIEKAGLALGPVLTALVLAVGGYVQSKDGQAAQPPSATQAIVVAVSVVPAMLFATSALVIGLYPLTERGLAALRRAKAASPG